jgi:hypothetical protein
VINRDALPIVETLSEPASTSSSYVAVVPVVASEVLVSGPLPLAPGGATSHSPSAAVMEFETPTQLMARLKLGREEYCQRLLTTLILNAPYPKWNSRSNPAPAGLDFLRRLYERSFAEPWPGDNAVLVDEFELPPASDDQMGGAPDYAVLWADRLWLVELKTERASHRHSQIPGYFELAHHHYPGAKIDVLYVTPPMQAPYPATESWARYAHTTWGDLVDLIRSAWPTGTSPGHQEVIDGLLAAIDSLSIKPAAWRAAMNAAVPDAPGLLDPASSTTEPRPKAAALDRALAEAALTAHDGRQRAVDIEFPSLEDLLALRLSVRDALADSPHGSPLRHVLPWIWRPESTGEALTISGRQRGLELRVSRYELPRY